MDDNQGEIVSALRKIGCEVAITSQVGNGFPDLVVGTPFQKRIVLLEVKDGAKVPSAQKLTEHEQRFHDEWSPYGAVFIVKNITEAIAAIK